MSRINPSCLGKLETAFPKHIQEMFHNLAGLASALGEPHQEVSLWWEPEDVEDGDLVPSITFRLTPVKKGADATTNS